MKSPTFYVMLVIVAVVVGAWQLPALIWGYQVSMESEKMRQGQDNRMSDLNGGPAPLRWFRDRKEYKEYFNTEALTKRRVVSFNEQIPFQALLASGEEPPAEGLRELYATARVPEYLMRYCPETLTGFAKGCGYAFSKASINRDGKVVLEGRLAVVPDYDLGDPSAVRNGKVFSANLVLWPRSEFFDNAQNRQRALSRAVELCDEMRSFYGNCVVSMVRFNRRQDHRKPNAAPRLDAWVSVSVYADKNIHTRQSVRDQFKQIGARLTN